MARLISRLGVRGSQLGGGLGISIGAPSYAIGSGSLYQIPYLIVHIDGNQVQNVTSVTVTSGFDMPYPTATIEVMPTGEDVMDAVNLGGFNSVVDIWAGTGGASSSPIRRFHGLIKRVQADIWPYVYRVQCRGMLSMASEYQQQPIDTAEFTNPGLDPFLVGLHLNELMGFSSDPQDATPVTEWPVGPTDETIVTQVLSQVPAPFSFDPADIGGTGTILGGGPEAYDSLTWMPGTSALDYIHKIDETALGFRTFESTDGHVYRFQIFGYPNNSSDLSFTEGVDIWDATGDNSIEELKNSIYVTGSGTPQGLVYAVIQSSNDLQATPVWESYSSPLIEQDRTGTDPDTGAGPALPGYGFIADDVAYWKNIESNRVIARLTMVTFRDDLIGPGQTHSLLVPHAGITQPLWCQQVELRAQAASSGSPIFQQTMQYLGGGLPGVNPPPAYT